GTLNTAICLYPPDGGPVEACPPNAGDFLDHQLAQSGLYTIVIFDGFFLSRMGDYNISLLRIPGGPLSSPGDLDGGPIASGQTLSGHMDMASDLDAFRSAERRVGRVLITPLATSGTINKTISLNPHDGEQVE